MQKDPNYLGLVPQMNPIDEPGVSAGVPNWLRRFARSIVLAPIMVPVLAIVTYYLLFFCAVAFAMAFGDFPLRESAVLREAGNFMVEQDHSFRVQEHDANIRWVGGRTGAWEIYFIHKLTRERRCVRWIDCGFVLGKYTFEE